MFTRKDTNDLLSWTYLKISSKYLSVWVVYIYQQYMTIFYNSHIWESQVIHFYKGEFKSYYKVARFFSKIATPESIKWLRESIILGITMHRDKINIVNEQVVLYYSLPHVSTIKCCKPLFAYHVNSKTISNIIWIE